MKEHGEEVWRKPLREIKKRIIGPLYCILYLGLIVLIAFLAFLCIKSYDPLDIPKSLTIMSTSFTCIAASLSAILASMSLQESQRQHRDNQKSEVFNRWYKELVLDKHLVSIRVFFDKCELLAKTLEEINVQRPTMTGEQYDEKIRSEVITPFTTEFTSIHKAVAVDVGIINPDLSSRISSQFKDFQDGFLKNTDKTGVNYEEMINTVKEGYKSVINSLLNFDMKTLDEDILTIFGQE